MSAKMNKEQFERWLEANVEDIVEKMPSGTRPANAWISDLSTRLRKLAGTEDDPEDEDEIEDDPDDEEEEEDEGEEEAFG